MYMREARWRTNWTWSVSMCTAWTLLMEMYYWDMGRRDGVVTGHEPEIDMVSLLNMGRRDDV